MENKHRNFSIVDIETVPKQGKEMPMPDDFVKYGNTKDEEKRKVIYEKALEQWESGVNKKMSLNGEYCQIVSMGIITIEAGSHKVLSEEVLFSEKDDLEIIQRAKQMIAFDRIIGWNSKGFDLPVLYKRAAIQGKPIRLSRYSDVTKKYDMERSIDLMHVWNEYGYGKLSDCAEALGIEAKTGMDGSKIYDAFKAGKYQEIKDYNLEDCRVNLEIARKLGIIKNEK